MERVGSNILKGEICMGIETQMHVVIQEELEKLKVMEIGTEEYKTTVDGVTKLVDRAIEMERLNNEITAGAVTRGDDRIDKILEENHNIVPYVFGRALGTERNGIHRLDSLANIAR